MELSLFDQLKDKFSLILNNPFSEFLQKATLSYRQSPDVDDLMYLSNRVNDISSTNDVIQAIRGRFATISDGMECIILIEIIEYLLNTSEVRIQRAISLHKPLLAEIVKIACGERQFTHHSDDAVKRTRLLLLNLECGFADHPDPSCRLLSLLAKRVIEISGPKTFEGIYADRLTSKNDLSKSGSTSNSNRKSNLNRSVSLSLSLPLKLDNSLLIAMTQKCDVFIQQLRHPATNCSAMKDRKYFDGILEEIRRDKQFLISHIPSLDEEELLQHALFVCDKQNEVLKQHDKIFSKNVTFKDDLVYKKLNPQSFKPMKAKEEITYEPDPIDKVLIITHEKLGKDNGEDYHFHSIGETISPSPVFSCENVNATFSTINDLSSDDFDAFLKRNFS